jgi:hypothetical protein
MPTQRTFIRPRDAGGMNDRTLTVMAELGLFRELRNVDCSTGTWARRYGHARSNEDRLPCDVVIGAHSYMDTDEVRHAILVGGDGNIYHSIDGGATWAKCVMHVEVVWDKTYQAVFADWNNDCFIAIGSLTGDGKNLRFRGLTCDVVGVGLDAPPSAPTILSGGDVYGALPSETTYTIADATVTAGDPTVIQDNAEGSQLADGVNIGDTVVWDTLGVAESRTIVSLAPGGDKSKVVVDSPCTPGEDKVATTSSWLSAPPTAPAVSIATIYTVGDFIEANPAGYNWPTSIPIVLQMLVASQLTGFIRFSSYRYCCAFVDLTTGSQGPASPVTTITNVQGTPFAQSDEIDVPIGFTANIVVPLYSGPNPLGHTIVTRLFRQDFDESTNDYGWMDWFADGEGGSGSGFGDAIYDDTAPFEYAPGGALLVPTGAHRYKYRYVDVSDPDQEFIGTGSPESTVFTLYNSTSVTIGLVPYAGTGRLINIEIFRFDTAFDDFNYVDTVPGNTTSYTDTAPDISANEVYVEHNPPPVMKQVACLPNGVVVWGNDVTDKRPADALFALDSENPEAASDTGPITIGDHSTPITVLYGGRDGVVAMKARYGGWFFITRECEVCSRMQSDVGSVGWATTQMVGNDILTLTLDGPMLTDHDMTTEFVRFPVDPRFGFALEGTWQKVVKSRLAYASSVHDRERGWVIWFVQMNPDSGDFNDTMLIWDYGSKSPQYPAGRMMIADTMMCHGFSMLGVDSDAELPFAAFPYGWTGPLFDGNHPDCMEAWPTDGGQDGYVEAASDGTVLLPPLDVDPVGMTLWVVEGTGTDPDTGIMTPADRARALITGQTSGGGYTLLGDVALDSTSRFVLGGFNRVVDMDGIDMGDPAFVKLLDEVEIIVGTVPEE